MLWMFVFLFNATVFADVITVDGRPVDYEVHGPKDAKKTILLFNGFVNNRSKFEDIIKSSVEKGHRVVSYSFSVHWESLRHAGTDVIGDVGVKDFAKEGKAVLDHLGIKKASLVGLSFGSYPMTEFAKMYPNHVDQIVMAAPAIRPTGIYQMPMADEMWPMFCMSKMNPVADASYRGCIRDATSKFVDQYYTDKKTGKVEIPGGLSRERLIDGVAKIPESFRYSDLKENIKDLKGHKISVIVGGKEYAPLLADQMKMIQVLEDSNIPYQLAVCEDCPHDIFGHQGKESGKIIDALLDFEEGRTGSFSIDKANGKVVMTPPPKNIMELKQGGCDSALNSMFWWIK